MYLFDLDMSNIKSEALARSALKKGILKNSAELTEKQLSGGISFIIKVQASWIKSNFYAQILPRTGVFQ